MGVGEGGEEAGEGDGSVVCDDGEVDSRGMPIWFVTGVGVRLAKLTP